MTEWFAQRPASPTTKPLELAQGHFVASTGQQRQQFYCGTCAEHLGMVFKTPCVQPGTDRVCQGLSGHEETT